MTEPVRLLVVDDDDDVREMLEMALVELGFTVASVANGSQALDHLREVATPPIVLLDLRMPVMNGWELVDVLRTEQRIPGVPIIICTSSPREAPSGFVVVPKPVQLDRLVAAIHRLSHEKSDAPGA